MLTPIVSLLLNDLLLSLTILGRHLLPCFISLLMLLVACILLVLCLLLSATSGLVAILLLLGGNCWSELELALEVLDLLANQ